MRDLEESSDKLGIPKDLLMENAGFSVANAVSKHVGPLTGLKIVALVGSGNNGSDCLIAGGHLSRWGASVTAIILRRRASPDIKLQEAINRGLLVVDLDDRKENFQSVESLIKDDLRINFKQSVI